MLPTVTSFFFFKVNVTMLTSLRTFELSRRLNKSRKFSIILITLCEESRLLNIHTKTLWGSQGGLFMWSRNWIVVLCSFFFFFSFWEIKGFFPSYFFLLSIQVQPNRENTVNIKSIINIYNLHILKILSITKMWGISSQQLVGPDVICMPQKASACYPRFVFDFACLLVLSAD